MEADDLSKHWETLLRRYYDRLVEKGVSGYSFDECVLHYRQNIVWALAQGMSLLGSLGPATNAASATRSSCAPCRTSRSWTPSRP